MHWLEKGFIWRINFILEDFLFIEWYHDMSRVCVYLWSRYARRERIKQQYAAIAADKLYSDVPPTVADEDYGPTTSISPAYMKATGRRPPATDYTHVWQLPLPQPHDDAVAGRVTSSSAGGGAAYGVGSVDSRYYVLDHNQSSSIIPVNDDIQFASAQWDSVNRRRGTVFDHWPVIGFRLCLGLVFQVFCPTRSIGLTITGHYSTGPNPIRNPIPNTLNNNISQ